MLAILAGLILLLPGICWAVWSEKTNADPLETLAKIFGVGISANALISLLLFLVGMQINVLYLWAGVAFWVVLILVGLFKRKPRKPVWLWLPALAGFSAVIAWRMAQASGLLVPAWVDSLHHVLIVRKIIESGGLMADMQPYLDVPFYYHYAFHTFAAQFSALSGLSPDQAVLVIGQVLNAAIGLSVYTLGKAIFKDWRPAFLAGLLVTFMTKMPAYYLTWGRYTLLMGMILLPLAMAKAIQLLEPGRRRVEWVEMALFTAGTLLAHYFTGIILALFLVCMGIGYLLRAWKQRILDWKPLLFLVFSVLAGFIIVLPWLWGVFMYTRMTLGLSTNLPAEIGTLFSNWDQWQYLWYLLGDNGGHVVLFGSVMGLALAFGRSKYRELALWGVIMFLLSLPRGLSLGSFRFDHFAIVLFLPLILFFSLFISEGMHFLDKVSQRKWLVWVLFGVVGLGAIIWGGFENRDIVNPKTVFTTQADLDAIAWIDENLPQESRFFINTTPWGYGVSRGIDGGAWILPLTSRWTLAPTLFYTFTIDDKVIKQNIDWGNRAQWMTGCSDELWKLIDDAALSHIYLHSGIGKLTASNLAPCEGLDMIYSEEGVTIFAIEQ